MKYIYAHKDNDEVVYIGIGSGDRAYQYKHRANKEHREFLERNLPDCVEILVDSLVEGEQAYHMEALLIDEYSPKFNKSNTDTSSTFTCPLGTFKSIGDAVRKTGWSRSFFRKKLDNENYGEYYYHETSG